MVSPPSLPIHLRITLVEGCAGGSTGTYIMSLGKAMLVYPGQFPKGPKVCHPCRGVAAAMVDQANSCK